MERKRIMDQRIKDIMKALDCTEEEALEMLADDDAIDHGEKLFELTAEQQKVSKAARAVDRKPAAQGTKQKRERKADQTKRDLIAAINAALINVADEAAIEITNIERQIDFTVEGRRFRVVLSAPRK
jgi:hypothetical protein